MRRFRADLFHAIATRWPLTFLTAAFLTALLGIAGWSAVTWNAFLVFSMLFFVSLSWQYAQRRGATEAVRDPAGLVPDVVLVRVPGTAGSPITVRTMGDGDGTPEGEVRNAVRDAMESNTLILGTKAIITAILRRGAQTGAAALKTLCDTSRTIVRETADLHGDVGQSTKGLVLGAIASAKGAALARPQAASAAAQSAVDEAAGISRATEIRVRGALMSPIGGMVVAVREASDEVGRVRP